MHWGKILKFMPTQNSTAITENIMRLINEPSLIVCFQSSHLKTSITHFYEFFQITMILFTSNIRFLEFNNMLVSDSIKKIS
jgi:hypothetical protein